VGGAARPSADRTGGEQVGGGAHGRKTVGRYVAAAVELGWRPGESEPTEELAGAVYRALRPSKDRGPDEVERRLLPHREKIRGWLTPGPGERRGLRLTKVHRLLEREGIEVPTARCTGSRSNTAAFRTAVG